jgi:hypothetical protein
MCDAERLVAVDEEVLKFNRVINAPSTRFPETRSESQRT